MPAEFWIKVKQQAKVWRRAFPGLAVVSCVVISPSNWVFQVLNGWLSTTFCSYACEAEDTQVVIIGIDENDIKAGDYPVPNRDLAKCSEFSRATSQGQLVSICLGISRLTQVMLS